MWIQVHDSLRDHPKILKLARDLRTGNATAIGLLVNLWTWVLRMAPDGCLSSFDSEDIEVASGWDGDPGLFFDSCVNRRLIDKDVNGVYHIHDWDDYSGTLDTAKRVRECRERKRLKIENEQKQADTNKCNVTVTDVTLQVLQCNNVTGNERNEREDREERKKDNINAPSAKSASSTKVEKHSEEIKQVWEHWLSRRPETRKKDLRTKDPDYKTIKKSLDSYSKEDLISAINGMLLDSWSVDTNQGIGWALRVDAKTNNIEKFSTKKPSAMVLHGTRPNQYGPQYEGMTRSFNRGDDAIKQSLIGSKKFEGVFEEVFKDAKR